MIAPSLLTRIQRHVTLNTPSRLREGTQVQKTLSYMAPLCQPLIRLFRIMDNMLVAPRRARLARLFPRHGGARQDSAQG